MSDEQRRAQRIDLPIPTDAFLADRPARIIEMSLIGCKVEHAEKIPIGSRLHLQFLHEGSTFRLPARVARTEMRGGGGLLHYVSGLELAQSIETAPVELVQFMESVAEKKRKESPAYSFESVPFMRHHEELEDGEPVADPAGEPAAEPEMDLDMEIELPGEARPLPFLECTLSNGEWSRRPTDSSTQPREGLTIPIEEESEADQYCRTYEVADEELRRMIRLTLELSIARRKG